MVIVAKDNAEYLLKREKLLKDYDNYAKTRDLYSKTKINYKETGMPLFPVIDEPKTSLEQLVDKSKTDENLVRLLQNELGTNIGEAKIFVQSLSDDLKLNLLERFAAFKTIFEKNYTISNSQSLSGAFEIFLKKTLYDSKVVAPSRESIKSYLETLSQENLKRIGDIVNNANIQAGLGGRKLLRDNTPTNVKNVEKVILFFIQNHKTDLIGFSSLYTLLEKSGFKAPKPSFTGESAETPSNVITTPINVSIPPQVERGEVVSSVPLPPMADVSPYDEDEQKQKLNRLTVTKLREFLRAYNSQVNKLNIDPANVPPKFKTTYLTATINNETKPKIIENLLKRKYDVDSNTFGILGQIPEVASVIEGVEETKGEFAEQSPLVRVPSDIESSGEGSGFRVRGRGMSVMFMR
jgi:hypothetical protein